MFLKIGEEGYPGELDFKAIYSLEGDTLTMHYHATTSKDTLINITNHSYFNLSGKKENVYQHLLKVHSDCFACIDPDGLPTGEIKDVKGTSFDFNEFAYIGDRVDNDDEQLQLGKGFDHPMIFNTKENQVELVHEKQEEN